MLSDIISNGSTDNGFVSQQFINKAIGVSSMDGVLLNGLVLKAFHKPELISDFLMSSELSLIENVSNSSFSESSISKDINLALGTALHKDILKIKDIKIFLKNQGCSVRQI